MPSHLFLFCLVLGFYRVNRTHLFRMNIDLRAMEAEAAELRAKMRDVLTRKLGKPRRVDRTLDDLLRQMARRHKFSATLGTLPQILNQLRQWRVSFYICFKLF